MEESSGHEAIASQFLRPRSSVIGAQEVKNWARTLPRGYSVIDPGCGSGLPITSVSADESLNVYAVDAAPSLVDEFLRNLPVCPS